MSRVTYVYFKNAGRINQVLIASTLGGKHCSLKAFVKLAITACRLQLVKCRIPPRGLGQTVVQVNEEEHMQNVHMQVISEPSNKTESVTGFTVSQR